MLRRRVAMWNNFYLYCSTDKEKMNEQLRNSSFETTAVLKYTEVVFVYKMCL